MKGKLQWIKKPKREGSGLTAAQIGTLYLLSGCFFAGSLLGCLLSARVCSVENGLLTYLQQYLAAEEADVVSAPDILTAIWELIRYPLVCAALHFVPAGRWVIPGVFAVRGFFLSFAVSALIRLLGGQGLTLAVRLFLPAALAALPCMMLWGIRPAEPFSFWRTAPLTAISAAVLLAAMPFLFL